MKLKRFVKQVERTTKKQAPVLLAGIAIFGVGFTAITATRATIKALDIVDDLKEQKAEAEEEVTKVDIVKATWKCYILPAASGVTTVACILGMHSVHARRNAALAAAYKATETAFIEYKDEVFKAIGKDKEKEIKEKVAQRNLDDHPIRESAIPVVSDKYLFYDPLSGRYFLSDKEIIRGAVNTINDTLNNIDTVNLNDFYYEIDLGATAIGDEIGWNRHRDGLINIEFEPGLAADGRPCLVLDWCVRPRYDYDRYY